MKPASLAYRMPRVVRRQLLHFEEMASDALAAFARSLPSGVRVLDAGAGETRHRELFPHQRYVSIDLAVGDQRWNYSKLDVLGDLTQLPFADQCFGAALNVVTLEHLREPAQALREIARTLSNGAVLFLVAPQEWEMHQTPHDYFRYTEHGLRYLLESAGFVQIAIRPAGGYFRLLSRRMLNGLQFFSGGARWLLFVPAALLLVPPALLLPLFERFDRERNFTLGYICTARRSS